MHLCSESDRNWAIQGLWAKKDHRGELDLFFQELMDYPFGSAHWIDITKNWVTIRELFHSLDGTGPRIENIVFVGTR